jgi:hypothetical protein
VFEEMRRGMIEESQTLRPSSLSNGIESWFIRVFGEITLIEEF